MLPEDDADTVERLGQPRPALPAGLEVVDALDCAAVARLAEQNHEVRRVLQLIEQMLDGDYEIDWAAGYSALETIKHDLATRALDGRELGWWTKAELEAFRATANTAHCQRRRRPSA
jgi:hypothetical protein